MSAKEERNYWRKGLEDNPMRRCVTARLLWRRVRREYLPSWILARRVTALALAVVFGFMSSVLALDLQEFVAETEHDGLVGAAAADQLHDGNNQDMTSAGEGRLRSAADYWYSISNDEVTITGYRGAGGDITIPGSIDEYPVTSIEDEAFSDCAVITSVTIPNSVTSIENYAFRECSSLTSVVIPDSVTRIGEGAFLRCSGLTSVVIPTSVTTIEMGAFCDCTGLTSVTIPNSVTIIGGQAFGSCSGLTSVEIPDSVTRIEFGAFSHCSGLTSVVIPDSVTSIEEMAFSDCSGLTSVVIPDSVISIRKYAFRGCSSLASVVIPNSVTSIENYAFCGCSSLTSVVIGDSVISIRESAFSGCSSLTSIYIWGTPPKVVLEGAFGSVPGTVYYIFGTAGWGAEFGGLPTAVWTSEVTFVGNGGTPSLSEQIYNAGAAYTELPTANRPDFNFTGWWTAAEEGSKVDTTTLVPLLTSGHTLYAQWEVPPGFFSVKFEWGVHGIRTGGGEQHQSIKDGMAAEAPQVTPRQGWGFVGWDRDFSHVTAPISVRALYSYPYTLASGWNLISVNLNLDEESKEPLLNNGAMTLDASSQAYALGGDLAASQACWVFALDEEEITLVGTSPEDFDFMAGLQPGWNFVGPMEDSLLMGNAAIAWGWDGQHLYPTKSILSGSGYYLYWPEDQAVIIPRPDDYLVIDLSVGPDVASYPVSTLTAVPADGWTDEYKTTKLVLSKIPAGTFIMGSPEGELGHNPDETQHQVTLTKDFYVGVFEVTQKQWERVMGVWPSYFTNANYRDSRPVEQVSYEDIRGSSAGAGWPANNAVDADSFLGRLRAKTGLTFDLPTEAQWEYACRAGTTTALNSGKNLTDVLECPNVAEVGRYLYNGRSGSPYSGGGDTSVGTAKVGSYLPNQWGLYDMHGNVWEWCLDWYGDYSQDKQIDPTDAAGGSHRVFRGGGWYYRADHCRSAFRYWFWPSFRFNGLGFRLVRTVP